MKTIHIRFNGCLYVVSATKSALDAYLHTGLVEHKLSIASKILGTLSELDVQEIINTL